MSVVWEGWGVAEGVPRKTSHWSGFLHGSECCIDAVFVLFGRFFFL